MALDEHAPGEARRPAGNDRLQRIGRRIKDACEIIELHVARLEAEEAILEAADQPTQALVDREIVDERLAATQLADCFLQRLRGLEEKPLVGEELPAPGLRHLTEAILARAQRLGQGGRGLARQFRRRRLDHRDDQVEPVEGLL